MQCTNPMWLRKEHMFVPCGHCLGCRIAHSREWTVRLLHEMSSHDSCCFLTLTYDEEHCPLSLDKKELQKFWKRLRKAIAPRKIKYFSCGEYGDTYGRPHYHAIVFGVDWNDENIINQCWQRGFIKVGGVTRKSIGYVTDYCLKKFDKRRNDDVYTKCGLQKPFQLCSQGLGLEFAVANRQQLQDDLGTTLNGKRVGLPRYYVRKLEIDTDIMAEVAKSKEAEKLSQVARRLNAEPYLNRSDMWYYTRYNGNPLFVDPLSSYLREVNRQKDINYQAKKRFRKGSF